MKSKEPNIQKGEFFLANMTIKVYAPTSMDDEAGEKLYTELDEILEGVASGVKQGIEEAHPELRVGYGA